MRSDIPIMKYAHDLENKVREAREETAKYRSLAFMSCVKGIQFWLGVGVGVCLALAFWVTEVSVSLIIRSLHR